MHRPMHLVRLAANVLHHVDLTALRPADGVDVGAEHPERRPESLSARDADASFDAPIGRLETALGYQPRRGVPTCPVPAAVGRIVRLGPRCDDEAARSVERGVRSAGRVILPPLTTPTLTAALGVPIGAVDRCPRGSVAL